MGLEIFRYEFTYEIQHIFYISNFKFKWIIILFFLFHIVSMKRKDNNEEVLLLLSLILLIIFSGSSFIIFLIVLELYTFITYYYFINTYTNSNSLSILILFNALLTIFLIFGSQSQSNIFPWEYIWILKLGTNLFYYLYRDCYQFINLNSLILLILSSKLVLSIIYLQLLPTGESSTFLILILVNSYLLILQDINRINKYNTSNYLIILYTYINTLMYIFILLNRETISNWIQEYLLLDLLNLLVISYLLRSSTSSLFGISWILCLPPLLSYYYKVIQYLIIGINNLLVILFNHLIIAYIIYYFYQLTTTTNYKN